MIDLAFFRDDGGPFVTQALADAVDSGREITGASKTAQRFVLELLTPLNDVAQEEIGCEFITRLRQSGFSSESDVFVAFTSSVGRVVSRLRAAETDEDTDAERLRKVGIVNLALGDGGLLQLNVRLGFASGVFEKVSIPLDFLV